MQAAAFVFAIKLGFIVAAGLQEFDAFLAEFDHLVTWTEVQSPGWQVLTQAGSMPVFQTIPAHCALVDLRLIAVVTGNVERTGHFAVAAADALFGRNGDNTVFFVLQTTRRATVTQPALVQWKQERRPKAIRRDAADCLTSSL